MRKLFLVLFVALMVSAVGMAQANLTLVLYRDAPTLSWDAVTTDVEGNLLVPEDEVTYDVYGYDWMAGITNDQDIAQLTYLGLATSNQLVLVFPYRTIWVVGVRTRVVQGDGTAYYAERIAWSNKEEDVDLVVMVSPFGYAPTLGLSIPAPAGGLRDSGM